jgi:hypothetical protein
MPPLFFLVGAVSVAGPCIQSVVLWPRHDRVTDRAPVSAPREESRNRRFLILFFSGSQVGHKENKARERGRLHAGKRIVRTTDMIVETRDWTLDKRYRSKSRLTLSFRKKVREMPVRQYML